MYHDEFGNLFSGPFGVGTFLSDSVVSYATEAEAREAAQAACNADDCVTQVYCPPRQGVFKTIGAQRAVILTHYEWNDETGAAEENPNRKRL